MEKRAILAALLMAGLLMVYQLLFVKPAPQDAAGATPEEGGPRAGPAPNGPGAPAGERTPIRRRRKPPVVPERQTVIETPLYRAVVSSQGGRFTTWDLIYRGDGRWSCAASSARSG